jgi:hypothetical protein
MHDALEFVRKLKEFNEDILSLDAPANQDFQLGMREGQRDAARMTLRQIERFYTELNNH